MTALPSPQHVVPAGGTLRFRVIAADKRTSDVWRIWTIKTTADVYVAARSVASEIKISLHASGVWQHGLTSTAAIEAGVDASKRLFQRWTSHPELVPGWQRPVQIILANAQLQHGAPRPPASVISVPAPNSRSASIIEIWIETPGQHNPIELTDSFLIGVVHRGDGGSVWVVSRQADLPWVPAERFDINIKEARSQRSSSGLPSSALRRIAVHDVDPDSGTLILCELAVD